MKNYPWQGMGNYKLMARAMVGIFGKTMSRARRAAKAMAVAFFAYAAVLTSTVAAPSNGDPAPPANVLRQLEQLAPQRPGVIDFYALVVGGDGSENVFQREVKLVQKRLEERLKASGHIKF